MTSDSQIMKMALIIAIIGIVSIFFIIQAIEPIKLSIGEITSSHVGHEVITNGTISSYYISDEHVFMIISDVSGEIKAVMFERDAKNSIAYNLKNNDRVLIKGAVNNYKGELEIVVREIKQL